MQSSPMGAKKRKRRRHKRYPAEFRAKAVQLAQTSGKPVAHIAKELGVNYGTLLGWVQAAESAEGTVAPPGETPEQELKRLRKENERLREEREILKKAATFFAKESE